MNEMAGDGQADLQYLSTLSILYVEDEDEVRDQLAQFLRRRCAVVYTASDGKKGLDAFSRRQPDIVVADILMPAMDGMAMCEAIRALNPRVPLIFTTAFEEPRYFHKAIELGAHQYVVKPIVPDALEQALLKAARSIRAELALREAHERYHLLFKLSHLAISVSAPYVQDDTELTLAKGRIVDCNDSFLELLGYSRRDELLEMDFESICTPASWNQTCRLLRDELPLRGFTHEYEMDLVHRGGGLVPVSVQLILRRDETGAAEQIWAVMRDLTERRETEARQRLAASVFEHSHEAILITGADNLIVSVNPAFTRITGYTAEQALGRNPRMLGSGRHGPEFYQAMWSALQANGYWQGEIWNRRLNGETYPEWLNISTVRDPEGRVVNHIGAFVDISDLKTAQERVEFLAHYDPLTSLANRVLLADRLNRALASAQRDGEHVAVLFIDLDRFKIVNDTLGHSAGDRLLMDVAKRMLAAVRDTDTVARIGGDEFVMLLTGLSGPAQAGQVAGKVLDGMRPAFELDGREFAVTPSIGISYYPDDGEDGETLLKHADAAMYQAKKSGRNAFAFYSPAMNAGSLERLSMELLLRRALELNQFVLHYQPQIDIATGRITGVEALMRWAHPEMGMVPPSRFIPLAEETGMIVAMGAWALREACRQNAEWQRLQLPKVSMAVNLSAVQFRQRDLLQTVLETLAGSGLSACWLELELTEGMLMESVESTLVTLREFRRAGLRMSVDDFGTGYSSLAYLKRFPIDRLKIDQSFVRGLPEDSSAAIAGAIISLGHELGLSVIAEGVETLEQFNFLRARQCDEAQGYLFAHALPADQMAGLLKSRVIKPD